MSNIFNIDPHDDTDLNIKLNMDELYQEKQQKDLAKLNVYKKMLLRVHNKIKTSNRMGKMKCCWYVVPEVILGIPCYDQPACIEYLVKQLEENGVIVRYNHPNTLFISWNHWLPTYVRNEIKKQTGVEVDGYGNVVEKNKGGNNIIESVKQSDNRKDFKDISTYKPSGKLSIYDSIFK